MVAKIRIIVVIPFSMGNFQSSLAGFLQRGRGRGKVHSTSSQKSLEITERIIELNKVWNFSITWIYVTLSLTSDAYLQSIVSSPCSISIFCDEDIVIGNLQMWVSSSMWKQTGFWTVLVSRNFIQSIGLKALQTYKSIKPVERSIKRRNEH